MHFGVQGVRFENPLEFARPLVLPPQALIVQSQTHRNIEKVRVGAEKPLEQHVRFLDVPC
jgi:hypothetical protein